MSEIAMVKSLILFFLYDDGIENPALPSDEYIAVMLARNDFHVIVALENNQVIGGLTAYEMKMFKRETTEMFLYEIGVVKSHRRKGIGKELIEFLKKICVEKGIVEIFVGTSKGNLAARNLYASSGGEADELSVWFSYKL